MCQVLIGDLFQILVTPLIIVVLFGLNLKKKKKISPIVRAARNMAP